MSIKTLTVLLAMLGFCHMQAQAQRHAALADSICRQAHIPELAYAVITTDSILEMAFVGHHSVNLPDTAAITDRFHIGSNTKAMTAFIAGKYVEEKKLKWSTRFFDLYPGWKKMANPAYYNITLQQLLSHRACIQPFTDDAEGKDMPELKGTHQEKRMELAKYVLTLSPVVIDTAAHYTYSNAGYVLAALMLEKAAGQSWEDMVLDVFNRDLHIQAGFSWPDNQLKKETWGHVLENGNLEPVPSSTTYRLDGMEPAGDLNFTLPDYIKFIQLNMSGLEGKNNYLKAKTYTSLHKGMPYYAMGWANVYDGGKEFSSHSGSAGTYFAYVSIDRKRHIAYIVFMNTATTEATDGFRNFLRRLKAEYGS